MSRYPDNHPATQYALRVMGGDIVACRYVQLACERYDRDRREGPDRGVTFDEDAANRVLKFFSILKHTKAEWCGQEFGLELWQAFIISNIFGFYGPDGTRRFRTVYEEIARKNGKSTMVAGVGNYLFTSDGEPGAEVYAAATKRDQARIVWEEAARQIKSTDPRLKKRVTIFRNNMHITKTACKFEPLGADTDGMDGLNIHGAIVDELHAHKKRDMWDVLVTATGSRRQPLIYAITTAGFDQSGICFEIRNYADQVLRGSVVDDSFFAMIYTLDRKADWPDMETEDDFTDESCWIKANPNLDVSVKRDDLRTAVAQAAASPASINNLLTKRFNVWTQQSNRWISLDLWDQNNSGSVIESDMDGRWCCAGIDLSAYSDLTCLVYLFPRDDDREWVDVLMRTYCPADRLHDPSNRYRDQYQAWAREGYLTVTPGNAIDYDFVLKQCEMDHKRFLVGLWGLDTAFQGIDFYNKLGVIVGHKEDVPKIISCSNTARKIGPVLNEFERRLLQKKINHGGNPVLRFMADSVAVKQDADGFNKLDKAGSQAKIDGIVSLVYALDRLMRSKPAEKSRYETEGAGVIAL